MGYCLQKRQLIFTNNVVGSEFAASKGWIWRFCKRHGMQELPLQGEKLSADSTGIDPFKKHCKKSRIKKL